jgi:hypothetical protein
MRTPAKRGTGVVGWLSSIRFSVRGSRVSSLLHIYLFLGSALVAVTLVAGAVLAVSDSDPAKSSPPKDSTKTSRGASGAASVETGLDVAVVAPTPVLAGGEPAAADCSVGDLTQSGPGCLVKAAGAITITPPKPAVIASTNGASIVCGEAGQNFVIPAGQKMTYRCWMEPPGGFTKAAISCAAPSGITCSVTPKTVAPPSGSSFPSNGDMYLTATVAPDASIRGPQDINLTARIDGMGPGFRQPSGQVTVSVVDPPPPLTLNDVIGVPAPAPAPNLPPMALTGCQADQINVDPGSSASVDCNVLSLTGIGGFSNTAWVGTLYPVSDNPGDSGIALTVDPGSVYLGGEIPKFKWVITVAEAAAPGVHMLRLGTSESLGGPIMGGSAHLQVWVNEPQPVASCAPATC